MPQSSAYSVTFDGTVLAGLTSLDAQINPEVDASVGIGSPYPQFSVIRGIRPGLNFQSRAIDAALTVTGVKGKTLTSAGAVVASFVAINDEDGAIGTTTRTYTIASGIVMPRQLSCNHGEDAVLDIQVLARSTDGATNPLVIGTSTPPTLVRDNARHTIKSVQVGNVTVNDVVQVQIDFGISAALVATNSDIFPKYVSQAGGITPTITIQTNDIAAVGSLTSEGTRGTHANSVITFRKYDPAAVGFADDDLALSASGIVVPQSASGQGPQIAAASIQMTCDWDGTNDAIKIVVPPT